MTDSEQKCPKSNRLSNGMTVDELAKLALAQGHERIEILERQLTASQQRVAELTRKWSNAKESVRIRDRELGLVIDSRDKAIAERDEAVANLNAKRGSGMNPSDKYAIGRLIEIGRKLPLLGILSYDSSNPHLLSDLQVVVRESVTTLGKVAALTAERDQLKAECEQFEQSLTRGTLETAKWCLRKIHHPDQYSIAKVIKERGNDCYHIGDYALVHKITARDCVIEMPLTPTELRTTFANSGSLRTICCCVGWPLSWIELLNPTPQE